LALDACTGILIWYESWLSVQTNMNTQLNPLFRAEVNT